MRCSTAMLCICSWQVQHGQFWKVKSGSWSEALQLSNTLGKPLEPNCDLSNLSHFRNEIIKFFDQFSMKRDFPMKYSIRLKNCVTGLLKILFDRKLTFLFHEIDLQCPNFRIEKVTTSFIFVSESKIINVDFFSLWQFLSGLTRLLRFCFWR